MRFNFFDLGAFNGAESAAMALIFAELGVSDYQLFMFEPCAENVKMLQTRFKGNDAKATLIEAAIADHNGTTQLFHSFKGNEAGHSIFASKHNVSQDVVEQVPCVVFSDWLRRTVPDFETAVNILKFNIEGAEWHLVKDLTAKNLWRYFKVICGDYEDVLKVAELEDRAPEHFERLRGIHIFSFSGQGGSVPGHEKALMQSAIGSLL